jgi:hypothetical protein
MEAVACLSNRALYRFPPGPSVLEGIDAPSLSRSITSKLEAGSQPEVDRRMRFATRI